MDRNTTYFHRKATMGRQKNHITSIEDTTGQWTKDDHQLGNFLISYYKFLFTASNIDLSILELVLFNSLYNHLKSLIAAPFTQQEVRHVVWKMGAQKVPGPDGFQIGVYKGHWDFLGQFITNLVLKILQGQQSKESYNYTDLVLIPKHNHPIVPVDFHLISLCNIVYKITTKIMDDRLSKVLPSIISDNQGLELFHQITKNNKSLSSKSNMALNLDLSKAFDKIEWPYLMAVLYKFDFSSSFSNLVITNAYPHQKSLFVSTKPKLYISNHPEVFVEMIPSLLSYLSYAYKS